MIYQINDYYKSVLERHVGKFHEKRRKEIHSRVQELICRHVNLSRFLILFSKVGSNVAVDGQSADCLRLLL